MSVDSIRVMCPLFQTGEGGSIPASTLQVRDLIFEVCPKKHAVSLIRKWHSRLPNCQRGPWQYAFHARQGDVTYAVALWNTPSGRCLPQHWLELRRMACSDDAPLNTCSAFLSWMVRYFRKHCPEREMVISYQDTAVHSGTIYKAAGWTAAYVSKFRVRDRSGNRVGTTRKYRWGINGVSADASPKVRWQTSLLQASAQSELSPCRLKVLSLTFGGPQQITRSHLPRDAQRALAQPVQQTSQLQANPESRRSRCLDSQSRQENPKSAISSLTTGDISTCGNCSTSIPGYENPHVGQEARRALKLAEAAARSAPGIDLKALAEMAMEV